MVRLTGRDKRRFREAFRLLARMEKDPKLMRCVVTPLDPLSDTGAKAPKLNKEHKPAKKRK